MTQEFRQYEDSHYDVIVWYLKCLPIVIREGFYITTAHQPGYQRLMSRGARRGRSLAGKQITARMLQQQKHPPTHWFGLTTCALHLITLCHWGSPHLQKRHSAEWRWCWNEAIGRSQVKSDACGHSLNSSSFSQWVAHAVSNALTNSITHPGTQSVKCLMKRQTMRSNS